MSAGMGVLGSVKGGKCSTFWKFVLNTIRQTHNKTAAS